MLPQLKKLDTWLYRRLSFILLLLLLIVLRLPSLCEPYWYGDEGIYLTIGHALSQGSRLYSDIVDHKTPLIYFLAMVPNQFWFRLLMMGWMIGTVMLFYKLAGAILHRHSSRVAATLAFVLLTSLPAFEGNIPNGELFVMGFVLAGGWLLAQTPLWKSFWAEPKEKVLARTQAADHPELHLNDLELTPGSLGKLIGAGVVFGLAILTKVPALFDLMAFVSVGWFTVSPIWSHWLVKLRHHRTWRWPVFPRVVTLGIIEQNALVIGAAVGMVLLSIVYFVLRGSGAEYLQYGLLYNFRYAASWGLPFADPLLVFAFTLPGKVLLLGLFLLLLTFGQTLFTRRFQFIASWFALTLVAALLSNRPYPHYFLQVMPALSLLLGIVWEGFQAFVNSYTHKRAGTLRLAGSPVKRESRHFISAAELGLAVALICWWIAILSLLKVGLYPTLSYYQSWGRLLTGQISKEQYRNKFNPVMSDNYRVAEIIKGAPDQRLFIWGTNPMLYALTNTIPTDRFTVAFHIKDFHSFDQSLADLQKYEPEYVVVMKDDSDTFPALNDYLVERYVPNQDFRYFTLWKEL